ncbi:hypothetical protein DPMN_028208 [Dreissena polymorpha]|uniref:Uncharacterized protein n=1 Tax=Dreissena polymorpha TaxID=45954 RepID=A0A9D4REC4_DREPO|nr:hypothetical protein DPMN_028208 [Dreissena polymorpha]
MIEKFKTTDNSPKLLRDALHTTEKPSVGFIDHDSQMTPIDFQVTSEIVKWFLDDHSRTLMARIMKLHSGGKANRVDTPSVVEAASVCGGKSHFATKLRICPPRHAVIRDMMPSRCAS